MQLFGSHFFGLLFAPVIFIGGMFGYVSDKQAANTRPVACTMEAKLCLDGSYVGRSGAKCEFSKCPTIATSTPSVRASSTMKVIIPKLLK